MNITGINPLILAREFWPHVKFYREQRELINSVHYYSDETYCVAGNMLGKDFVAGFIALSEFLLNREARIITTSVKDDHLRVLWGEIGRYIQSSKYPLTHDKGEHLVVNHRDIRKRVMAQQGQVCPISYLRGMVSEKGEGMAGHHARYTLVIGDEASGLDNLVYTQAMTWARKALWIGNPNQTENFFYQGVTGGDLVYS